MAKSLANFRLLLPFIVATSLLIGCTASTLPQVGQSLRLKSPVIVCPTRDLTLRLLSAARAKDTQGFLGEMLGHGGVCVQIPSGVSVVVTSIDSSQMLVGIRLSDAENGGTVWTPAQMLVDASAG